MSKKPMVIGTNIPYLEAFLTSKIPFSVASNITFVPKAENNNAV